MTLPLQGSLDDIVKTIIGMLAGVILAVIPVNLPGAEILQEWDASVKDAEEVGLEVGGRDKIGD